MPIPTPRNNEDRNGFISRCVSFLKTEDENMSNDQAVAICNTQRKDNKVDNTFNYSISISESASYKQGGSDVFAIKGIAINSTTTRNGHTFLSEELEKSASGLIGRPILKDHTNTVDSVVGKVTDAFYDSMTQAIKFEAQIYDESIQNKIKNGLINKVSVGAHVLNVEESDDDTIVLRGIDFVELSLVAVPADNGAEFAMAVMQSFNISNKTDELNKEKMDNKTKEVETKVEETIQEDVKKDSEVSELKTMIEALVESNKSLSEKVAELQTVRESDEQSTEEVTEETTTEETDVVEEKINETKGKVAKEVTETQNEYDSFVLEKAKEGFELYRADFSDSKILGRGN